MSIFPEINIPCIKELLKPVNLVLDHDLEKIRRMDIVRRTEMWNSIATNLQKFEEKKCGETGFDIQADVSGKFAIARLLLATAAYANSEDNLIIKDFNEIELNLLKDLERYTIFDIYSIDESTERIFRKECGLYELITEYYEKGYNNLDKILENPSILRDLKIAFKNRYVSKQKKITEITVACIERYGLSWLKPAFFQKRKNQKKETNTIKGRATRGKED